MAGEKQPGKFMEMLKKHSNDILFYGLIIYVILLAFATADEIFGWNILADIL
jgi:hypothetical protein